MHSLNPLFLHTVNVERSNFNKIAKEAKVDKFVYPSKHFFERVVERNLSALDAFAMMVPVIREFRNSTYNQRSFCVIWKQYKLFANFTVGPISGERKICMKTMYDRDIDESNFDVVIKL